MPRCSYYFLLAEKERFELSRRYSRPTPLAGAPLRPLEYFSVKYGRPSFGSLPNYYSKFSPLCQDFFRKKRKKRGEKDGGKDAGGKNGAKIKRTPFRRGTMRERVGKTVRKTRAGKTVRKSSERLFAAVRCGVGRGEKDDGKPTGGKNGAKSVQMPFRRDAVRGRAGRTVENTRARKAARKACKCLFAAVRCGGG